MNKLKNTNTNYGLVTKLLHIIFVLLFITQYYLVYRRAYFPENSASSIQYILLHKSIGFSALFLGLFAIIWAIINKHPKLPNNIPCWEKFLAGLSKFLLYCTIFLMPLSGSLMSFFGGNGLSWFGIPVYNLFTTNKIFASSLYYFHVYFSYFIIALVIIHCIAALKHKFVYKNNVLQRMWKF
tara:strand:- start:34074 stop:34619 length:546 start_codon:yes stop_codon:yes gene_type:complete